MVTTEITECFAAQIKARAGKLGLRVESQGKRVKMDRLDDDTFEMIIDCTPLISIDLVVRESSGRILLGQRLNRPAQGFWSVPGSRIL